MSTLGLLRLAFAEGLNFIKDLLELASAELKGQLSKLAMGLAFSVAAGFMVLLAIPFLLMGGIELLIANGFSDFVAFFIGGGVLLLIALIFGVVGVLNLKGLNFTPKRTLNQIKRISAEAEAKTRP
jgi:Cu/Ag efflux pump CusA